MVWLSYWSFDYFWSTDIFALKQIRENQSPVRHSMAYGDKKKKNVVAFSSSTVPVNTVLLEHIKSWFKSISLQNNM